MHSNEKVLRAALDAVANRDREAFAEVSAEDMIVHVPGRSPLAGDHRGRGALGAKIAELTGGRLAVEVHDVLATDDHAVGIYTMRVDGRLGSIAWRHVNVYHIRDGRIVEVWQNPFEQEAFDDFFCEHAAKG